jgi:hypothetical protein
VKVLSVRQPFATLILLGIKQVENRTWPIRQLGRIGIHAAASPVGRGWHDIFECPRPVAPDEVIGLGPDVYGLACAGVDLPAWNDLKLGCVLGSVEVYDCLSLEQYQARTREPSPFASGPFCWLLRAPRLLRTPVPAKGKLSLWEAPKGLRLR